MPDTIRVRLVPKTRDGRSITVDMSEMSPGTAKSFAPDPGRAAEAKRAALDLGLAAKITRHDAVEASLPPADFQQLFQTELYDAEEIPGFESDLAPALSVRHSPSMTLPRAELAVPESMRDTIAFAYVPTPVEFFGASFIPPNVGLYHLRLSEVCAALRGAECHTRGWTGSGIRIAMTDTGFAPHPYFDRQGYDILRVRTPDVSEPSVDSNGHGTGESANALALAPDCVLIGVKHDDYSALALETALEQNPNIITNSWGWNIDFLSKAQLRAQNPNLYNELRDLENIINDAIDDGVVVAFSAGNGHLAFPASMPDVLAVGGVSVETDGSLQASSYASSFTSKLYPGRKVPDVCGVVGEWIAAGGPLPGHIMLPVPEGCSLEGENMPGATPNGWGIFSGTSASSPQIAGVVALMLSIKPGLEPNEVRSILQSTAVDVTSGTTATGGQAKSGYDDATGAGFVNALEACRLAAGMAGL